jgi:integrase
MTSVYKHVRGGWYCSVTLPCGKRTQVYLGRLTKAQSEHIGRLLEHLRIAKSRGVDVSAECQQWIDRVQAGPFRDKLISLGLFASREQHTIKSWAEKYLASRSDFSPLTERNWKSANSTYCKLLGSETRLQDVTVLDAKQMAKTLEKESASSSAAKLVSRAKQLFQAAVDAKVINENPFHAVVLHGKTDKGRQSYIPEETADSVWAACPGLEIKAVFALARWCGLRVPSEPLALRWSDVDWAEKRLRIPTNTKTGQRIIPLFPKALTAIENLWDSLGDECPEFVFNQYRASANKTWRQQLEAAIKSAGLTQWHKLWVNLRASCRTDLEDRFPSHVCDVWLGHSSAVAKDHYLLVTPDHWQQAQQ